MQVFLSGEADILISTSIIESGLDIPRANTIFIDRADRFGLADLHQLRGRVGRYRHQASAYLLYDAHNPPRGDAALRLKALEELSALGAGFQIAMRDLEIRGADNILGPQQSGHIAAVGYDMYCRLLQGAAAALKGESPPPVEQDPDLVLGVPARIPESYIAEEEMRIEALRLMEEGAARGGLEQVEEALRDRYGRPPPEVVNLARLFHLRRRAAEQRLEGIRYLPPDRFLVTHPAGRPPKGEWLEAFAAVRPVEMRETHLILPAGVAGAQAALLFLVGCFS